MTLRISAIEAHPDRLGLAGRLTAEVQPELLRACAEFGAHVVLDLTELHFADRQGVRVLRELRAQGARLIGVSHYLGLLLGETPSDGK
jgi:anti-anti-sigma regulatory factor